MPGMDAYPAATVLTDPAVAYRGRLGPLYRLMLVNFALTLVTLGIWRFWARTRIRRFLWAHTFVGGEAFEYTGTGGELLKGFLRALLIFLPLGLLVGFGQLFLPEAVVPFVTIAAYLLLFFLALVGSFAAQRYQLRRTTWRGIRFGMDGSPFAYGRAMLWRWLLLPFTLFMMLPWIAAASLRHTLGRARFGSARATFAGEGGTLFPWMILAVGVFFLALIPGIAVAGGVIWAAFDAMVRGPGPTLDPGAILLAIAALYGVLIFAFAMAGAVYAAATLRFTYENATLGALRFGFTPGIGRTAWFLIGNALLVLASLGLLLPYALHRRMHFLAAGMTVTGTLDLAAIAQATAGETHGEGLADALGLDAGPI
jgi:uncharacterized membrane protein YjgN (DUF898 family)